MNKNIKIINVRQHPEYLDIAIKYFQDKWATANSKKVYEDSITRSITAKSCLPIWYLLEENGKIIGCCGLITNDFNSSSDLYPWLCALYIEKDKRGNNFGKILIEQTIKDSTSAGFDSVYLCTDHIGYYEKYDFEYIGDTYHPWGETSRVYEYKIK